MMRPLLFALCSLLLAPGSALAEPPPATPESRSLTYPELAEEGAAPPQLRIDLGGAPLTVHFPGERLDPRPEVHLVSAPEAVELRVAEKAAYLLALSPSAALGPVLLTLTLEGGQPLIFQLLPTTTGEASDSLVEVRLPEVQAEAACPVRLAQATDELAVCEKRRASGGMNEVATFLAKRVQAKGPTMVRPVGMRDKQHHLFVEVVDELRFGTHSFLRLTVENRDPDGPRWRPGEPRVEVVDPREPRRLEVHVGFDAESPEIGPREEMALVVAFEAPQLARGTYLRLVIPEAEGKRHLVIDEL